MKYLKTEEFSLFKNQEHFKKYWFFFLNLIIIMLIMLKPMCRHRLLLFTGVYFGEKFEKFNKYEVCQINR